MSTLLAVFDNLPFDVVVLHAQSVLMNLLRDDSYAVLRSQQVSYMTTKI